MFKQSTNIWQLAKNAALTNASYAQKKNRFVVKSFFQIVFLTVRKNWTHTHNFKDVVELVVECGAQEIQTHLLGAPTNATYLLPQYISKMIQVMADYVK